MTTTTGPKTVEQIARDFDNMPRLSMYLPIRLGLNMPQGYRAEALVLLAKVEDGVQDASKAPTTAQPVECWITCGTNTSRLDARSWSSPALMHGFIKSYL